jgi:hypothetical protein
MWNGRKVKGNKRKRAMGSTTTCKEAATHGGTSLQDELRERTIASSRF